MLSPLELLERERLNQLHFIDRYRDPQDLQHVWKAVNEAVEQVKKLDVAIEKLRVEDCPICHGAGATTDHHDPCTECGGSGKVGGG